MEKPGKIQCEGIGCDAMIPKSRNGLRRFCDDCRAKRQRKRQSLKTKKLKCVQCGSYFDGQPGRNRCYRCNPNVRLKNASKLEISRKGIIICECGYEFEGHGNRKYCDECIIKNKENKKKGKISRGIEYEQLSMKLD